MKVFIVRTAIIVVISLLAIVSVNYFVDPAHIFRREAFLNATLEIISENKNVANIKNFDERLFQKYYIEDLGNKNNIITLGSSRALQIGKEIFPGNNYFNHSVSGSVLNDYCAIINMLVEKDIKIDTLILGVDPWLFNKHFNDIRWKSISNDYFSFCRKIEYPYNDSKIEKIKYLYTRILELFSFSYFQASFHELFNQGIYATSKDTLNTSIKFADGSIFEHGYENRTQDEINELAKTYNYEKSDQFTSLDSSKIVLFDKLLSFLNSKNIHVFLYLCPYHPITYQNIIMPNKTYQQFEEYINHVAELYHDKIIGSINPHDFNFTECDFYDGMHLRREATIKVFKTSYFDLK